MALKFGEGTYGQFDQQEQGEPLTEPLLVESPSELMPPKIINPDEAIQCYGQVEPVSVVLQNGVWSVVSNPKAVEISGFYITGDRFEETPEGVYEVRGNERKSKLTNATVRIKSICEVYTDDETKETILVCAISCYEAWGDEEKLIEVPSRQYKTLFKKIKEEFRDIQLSSQSIDALDEYLTRVNQRDAKGDALDLPHEVCSLYIGWLTVNGQARYYIGEGDFYQSYYMPQVLDERRTEIFNTGFGFRNVGHGNNVIETLFLFVHTAYTNYFFDKAGCPMRTLLFLKGRTNSLKTSTASALANIFSTSTNDCGIRLSSTQASLREYIVSLRDNVVLVDDFSNSTGADNAAMERNAEMIIRAVGDGKFSSVMSMAETKKINTRLVRAAVVLTGEEMLNLSQSSMFRILTLEVEQGTFDGNVLRFYEDKKILREYFALFVRFLSEVNLHVVEYCQTTFPQYRDYYKSKLTIPRFIDFAAIMTLQADIIGYFEQWCGLSEQFAVEYRERSISCLMSILAEHQANSQQQDGVKRFLQALFQIFHGGKWSQIANDEKVFAETPSIFIGFREDSSGTLWLLFEEAYSLVAEHYRKLNEPWTIKGATIKEELLRRKISVGKLKSEGAEKNEFLKRAKKVTIGNSRPRMLVLKLEAVDQVLNEN